MVLLSIGSVVLVRFPFSDLSASKRRPAIVLSGVDYDDWTLCQVTSRSYSDVRAVEISESNFSKGSLMRTRYARPGKLFSANTSLMQRVVGTLKFPKQKAIVDAVVAILRPLRAPRTGDG